MAGKRAAKANLIKNSHLGHSSRVMLSFMKYSPPPIRENYARAMAIAGRRSTK
jgi:hypothetical protein